MGRVNPWKPFEGWQDVQPIKDEVERAFAKGARVRVETLRGALARVVADGWTGPYNDREWESISGTRMSLKRALAIVRNAQETSLPRVLLSHPDKGVTCGGASSCDHPDHDALDDTGPLFHEEPVEIDRDALIAWYFADLRPIYGTVRI